MPVAPNPFSVKNPPSPAPSPRPIAPVRNIDPAPATDKNSGEAVPSERSYIKDAGEFLLKTQTISIPVTAITVGLMTVMRTYVSSALGARFIIQTTGQVLIFPARAAMLSVWAAVTAGSGTVLYLASKSGQWPFDDEHPGIKKFGDNFRSATDNSVLTPISNLYHSVVPRRSERVSSPNIEEKLEDAGALFKGGSADQPKQPDVQPVPAVEEETPVSYPDPDILKPTVNISGYLNLTYYNCPDYNLGPYQVDWSAKLSRKPDTTDVAYSGSIEIPDFVSVGTVDVVWDQSAGKWKMSMKSQYFSVTSLINSFSEDISQGRLTGDLKIRPEALESLDFGQCTAGAGSFGGSIIK